MSNTKLFSILGDGKFEHLTIGTEFFKNMNTHRYAQINSGLLWILGLFFSVMIILEYFVDRDWNIYIPSLGNTLTKSILMSVHFIGGILLMILLPFPWIISKYSPLHMYLGGVICLAGTVTSSAGLIYIFRYGTIGGIFMDICFGMYGCCLFLASVCHPVRAYLHRRKYQQSLILYDPISSDHPVTGRMIYLLGYSSLFYRMGYTFAEVFGNYRTPDSGYSDPNIQEMYHRPLDRFLQVSFFTFPLLGYGFWKKWGHRILYLDRFCGFLGIIFQLMIMGALISLF